MKSRLSSLDIRAIANELDVRLSNKYIQNFYSQQQRFMYVKFSNHDVLLMEPGVCVRLTTAYDAEISHFCRKLRERCRHARVRSVYQYSFDRIIVIDIGRCKIAVEMFSGGNILILDAEDQIVDLLRPVPDLGITKNTKYIWNPVELDLSFDNFLSVGLEGMLPFENEFVAAVGSELAKRFGPLETLRNEEYRIRLDEYFCALSGRITRLGGFGQVIFKNGLPGQLFAFPAVEGRDAFDMEHASSSSPQGCVGPEGSPERSSANAVQGEDRLAANQNAEDRQASEGYVCDASREASGLGDALCTLDINVQGCAKNLIDEEAIAKVQSIAQFAREEVARVLARNKNIKALNFPTMNEAVEFAFSDRRKVPKAKQNKAERISQAQLRYIDELQAQADTYAQAAGILERNRNFICDILRIFSKAYEHKIKWDVFGTFWEEEKRRGNPHSLAIVSYDLEHRTAIVRVEDMPIEMRIDQSPNQIISELYTRKRRAQYKAIKTEEARNSIVDKLCPKGVAVKPQKRVAYWFERYHWFFTSDGVLVIGGKNAQDNERVVKAHMEKDDLYFHCEVHGASSVICKGRSEVAIGEAAYAALVLSKCWDEGVIKRVFYVEPGQVSKSAPSGEYLSKGGFAIVGKKNFLDPYRLEYGIGLLFKEKNSQPLEFNNAPVISVVHALPVCAPWPVIKNYKYRARLCSGNDKKSVLAHTVQRLFTEQCKDTPEEAAVKAVGIDEYINVIFNKARLAKIVK